MSKLEADLAQVGFVVLVRTESSHKVCLRAANIVGWSGSDGDGCWIRIRDEDELILVRGTFEAVSQSILAAMQATP